MRDYYHIDKYISSLYKDIYPQPQDERHTIWAEEAIDVFIREIPMRVFNVLDAGCGEGFCQRIFEKHDIQYTGVCIGEDYQTALSNRKHVKQCDFSFLPFSDRRFDFVFSRHSLEHSPIPLLTLMEWGRVGEYIALVLPNPEYWGYSGKNHYFVLNKQQWLGLFDVANLDVIYEYENEADMTPDRTGKLSKIEYWFLLRTQTNEN